MNFVAMSAHQRTGRCTTTRRGHFAVLTRMFAAVLFLAGAIVPPRSAAQPAPRDSTATKQGRATVQGPRHPNHTPYRSDRSFIRHVLAAPSYVLRYATRPLGWAVKEAEERFPQVFEGRLPPYGAYPVFETGGTSGFAGGVVLFYNDLPWGGHSAEARALVGSRAYNRFEVQYDVPGAFGLRATTLRLRGRHANDPRERFYAGGNGAAEEDRAFYASGETSLRVEVATDWSPRLETDAGLRVERIRIEPGEAKLDDEDEQRLSTGLPGVGAATLASVTADVALDLTSPTARSVKGTRLRLGTEYAQDLGGTGGDAFRFVRYQAEAVQFVPLPLLPPQRRLALRGLLEKTEPLGGGARVPFYHWPSLGGSEHLRGYRTNRFASEGMLLVTAEYRWPVWDNLDALLLAEAGQVFSSYSDLAPGRFHASYGGGLHLVTGGKLAFRFEVAGSSEGVRTILTVEPAF